MISPHDGINGPRGGDTGFESRHRRAVQHEHVYADRVGTPGPPGRGATFDSWDVHARWALCKAYIARPGRHDCIGYIVCGEPRAGQPNSADRPTNPHDAPTYTHPIIDPYHQTEVHSMTAPAPFREAAGGFSGDVTPWPRDLIGRLIFIRPIPGSYDANAMYGTPPTPRPTVRADVLVLDASQFGLVGGPLEYGGKGDPTNPHTDRITTPAFFQGMLFSQTNIVRELATELDDVAAGRSAGLMIGIPYLSDKGTKGNPPLNLGKVRVDQWGRPRPNADAIWAYANEAFMAWSAGQLPLAGKSELIAPPPYASPDVQKRYAERLAARGATVAVAQPTAPTSSAYAPPAPTSPAPAPQYTAPAQPQAQAQQYTNGIPGMPQAPQVQAFTPPPPPAPAGNPDDEIAPGFTADAWANVDAGTRAMIWNGVRARQVQPTH